MIIINMKRLNEGVFDTIAKMLALPTIQRELNKARTMVNDDPDLVETFNDLKIGYEKLKEKLPGFCKRNPESPMCKEKKKD